MAASAIVDLPTPESPVNQKTLETPSKQNALNKLGQNSEITRFKGLGEISPEEFAHFIGDDMLLEPVFIQSDSNIDKTLSYYMGRNTPDRQNFIINNLYIEDSL